MRLATRVLCVFFFLCFLLESCGGASLLSCRLGEEGETLSSFSSTLS